MTATTSEDRALEAADGQRHALGLTLALVLPLAAVVVETAASRVAGFPRVVTFVATALTVVVGIVLVPDARRLDLRRLGARFAGLLLIAFALRFAHPSPTAAWTAYRDGDEALASARLLVPLVLLVFALGATQVISTRVAAAIVGSRTANADRAREVTALQVWFASTTLLLLLAASPAGRVPWVLACIVAGPLAALFVLAELRTMLRGPDSERAVLRGGPRRLVPGTAAAALGAVVVLGTVAVVALPPAAMEGRGRPSEWVGEAFDWDFRQRTGARDGVVGAGRHVESDDDADGTGSRGPVRNVFADVPNPPWWVVVVVLGLIAWMVFRPGHWRTLLARLRQLVRGVFGLATEDDDVSAWSGEDVERGRQRGWRQALQRFLPRPRDPRQAVIYDYLRVERALAREGEGHVRARERWETPLEHARRVTLGEAHAELAALTSRARFARQPPSDADAERSLALRQAVERLLDRADEASGSSDQTPVA
ncbi:DUF4129 domain-containing protein [Egicoccus sp. AB-alg6-2]|uniref:DUF4129 domain-containing protein n=1 Tax=Egicoccus sp. AB-alg6-2 TaxID=3242692 RepID=UPI00359ED5F4